MASARVLMFSLLQIFFFVNFIVDHNKVVGQEINFLPGLKKQPNFKHYSGYLNGSATHFLHYWFVESQSNPSKDPVLVWMNGGPGCSSLDGFLSELGPFQVQDDATLKNNPYAWNKRANVIFLEAPAGVGFSYSSDGNVATNDDKTSAENYAALKHFFSIFPQFKENEFYITGESYAGIYVPTLAQRFVLGIREFPVNFKGIAVGNGFLDQDLNTNTLVQFAYNHGLIDEKTWDVLEHVCCGGCSDSCDFAEPEPGYCNKTVDSIMYNVYEMGLNIYDLYRECYNFTPTSFQRFEFDMRSAFPKHKHVLNNYMDKKRRHTHHNVGSPPCLNDTAIRTYLNLQEIKKALHIKEGLPDWTVCSDTVERNYVNIYKNMSSQFQLLLKNGIKILVYNGDTDMACNFLMNQKFVFGLNGTIKSSKKAWHVNNQIAGYVTKYEGVDFVTIKGTGHMVPQWKPVQAYHMIKSFLDDVPL